MNQVFKFSEISLPKTSFFLINRRGASKFCEIFLFSRIFNCDNFQNSLACSRREFLLEWKIMESYEFLHVAYYEKLLSLFLKLTPKNCMKWFSRPEASFSNCRVFFSQLAKIKIKLRVEVIKYVIKLLFIYAPEGKQKKSTLIRFIHSVRRARINLAKSE